LGFFDVDVELQTIEKLKAKAAVSEEKHRTSYQNVCSFLLQAGSDALEMQDSWYRARQGLKTDFQDR
jgi:hypothetical protein